MGDYVALIHGEGTRPGLTSASALFRGLHRPLNETESDDTVYVYVMKPAQAFAYPNPYEYSLVAVPPPLDSVFVAYAEIDENQPFSSRLISETIPSDVHGIVIGWEWTLAATNGKDLPRDYRTRYVKQVW